MNAITTHVLDTAKGRPAPGVPVELETLTAAGWKHIGRGVTDADGRLRTLLPTEAAIEAGVYRLVFETGEYFRASNTTAFHPRVLVEFAVESGETHYHVPLLLSPFGYTTYRGT
jgi:5-hydroxyisourate hydrolase